MLLLMLFASFGMLKAADLPLDFEAGTDAYTFTDFDGGQMTVIANPYAAGINTSSFVAQMIKNAGQVWGGSYITLDSNMDFVTYNTFTMKVFSPRADAKVLLKVENSANTSENFEKEVLTTKANEWEELTFNYSAINNTLTYDRIVIIIDNGTQGDGSADFTFLIDDIALSYTEVVVAEPQTAAPTPPARVSTDVISIFSDAYTSLENTDFNPSWGQSTVVSTVLVESNNTLKYANLNYQGTEFASAIDASGMEYMHVDMWTADAALVNLSAISTGPVEKAYSLAITAESWVSYDIPISAFSDVVNMSDIIQLKFDGTAGSTIYLDNIYFYKAGVSPEPELPLDFESATTDYTFTNFDGGDATKIANPQQTGINTSANVVQMIKNAGQSWGGSYLTLKDPIDFGDYDAMTMKVYAPYVGAKVLLKVENAANGGIAYEKEAATTVANEWEELTFDYSAIDKANEYQKVVIIFELGTVGDGSANFTYLFDDIALGMLPVPSDDASLSDLMVDGTTVTGFSSEVLDYTVELPYGTTVVPTVTAETTDSNASLDITPAASLPGTTTVTVTAEDGTEAVYSVEFTIAVSVLDDEISAFKAWSSNGRLNLEIDSDFINGRVEAFDMTGSRVLSSVITSTESSYALQTNGILIVRISDQEGSHTFAQKLYMY